MTPVPKNWRAIHSLALSYAATLTFLSHPTCVGTTTNPIDEHFFNQLTSVDLSTELLAEDYVSVLPAAH